MTRVPRIARIRLVVSNLATAERQYRALGFEAASEAREERAAEGRTTSLRLTLGEEEIELAQCDPPGRPYPADSTSADLWFQHFAIVVVDMDDAHARVRSEAGFEAISRGGPQTLPANTGGVRAFKFRDADGHPLELLQFRRDDEPGRWRNRSARGAFLGIDHSAIAVADAAASEAFYAAYGFCVDGRSLNRGAEQACLDDLQAPEVDVVGLRAADDRLPRLELLGYRIPRGRPAPAMAANDIAATSLVLEADVKHGRVEHDPDGHRLQLIPAAPPGDRPRAARSR